MGESKTQADKFKDAARLVEADESADALDRVMNRIDVKKPGHKNETPGRSQGHASGVPHRVDGE